mmetsp:Transcript_18540/g.23874  ORF Transcript_18540/g.23874 Transcript_18540/m.23874 type:complete len:203 (-) Transcript_18540:167-775(-)
MLATSSSAIFRICIKSCSKARVGRLFPLVTNNCSVMGSESRGSLPNEELSTGTGLQPTILCFLARTNRSTTDLSSVIRPDSSEPCGKKMLLTAYSPTFGRVAPNNFCASARMKESGIPNNIPDPSPDAGSHPHPPRCAMRTNISSALFTMSRVGSDLRLAIKPTPQFSVSFSGVYKSLGILPAAAISGDRNLRTRSVLYNIR